MSTKTKNKSGATKRAPKTTSTDPVANTASQQSDKSQVHAGGAGEGDGRNVVAEFDPINPEAWAWLSDPESIPGVVVYAPDEDGQMVITPLSLILFLGDAVPVEISQLVGRPLNLAEAKYLVRADGPMVTCYMTGIKFQPIMYVAKITQTMRNQIPSDPNGKLVNALENVELYYGGSFYVDKTKAPKAVSGAVYVWQVQEENYRHSGSSPLVMAAEAKREETGRKIWAVPLHIACRQQMVRKVNNDLRDVVYKKMRDLRAPSRGLTRVGEAFEVSRRNGKKPFSHRQQQEVGE